MVERRLGVLRERTGVGLGRRWLPHGWRGITDGLKRCCWWPKDMRSVKRPGVCGWHDSAFGVGWSATFKKRDVSALVDQPCSGRPRRAARLTAKRLAAAMARDPRRCGYLATTWTVPLLAHYLATHDGIDISQRTLRRRLHEVGWRWKRPRYVFSEREAHLAQKKGG